MKFNKFIKDDDAVSPVIGVILMVAITVILAAVIATFVLGLGEQVSQTAPNASFSFSFEEIDGDVDSSFEEGNSEVDGLLTATHSGGTTVRAERLSVRGASGAEGNFADDTDFDPQYERGSRVRAGDSISVGVDRGDTVRIIWTSQDDGDSATLSRFDVPE